MAESGSIRSLKTSLPWVEAFYEPATSSCCYLLADRRSGRAAIIDAVLDFDARAARTATRTVDALLKAAQGLTVAAIIETHTHADHLSAAALLREHLGAPIVTGKGVTTVQATWAAIFNLDGSFRPDGSQFDRLMADGDRLSVGGLQCEFWDTPGHTPACQTIVARAPDGATAAFIGDTLFMPDYGSARCDFPGGDARVLYRSIRRILSLPPETRLFVCHDYCPGDRPPACETTVGEERRANIHINDTVDEDAFVAMRTARDKTLSTPALLLPAIQVNIRAGRMPEPEANGSAYLKLPIDRL